ncbi:MAG: YigZ family protein [Candidatus Cloacimonetes bacterium]|nr:YigZ family protein [Candidatus Cloacimonadota bacterium]
MFSNIGKLAIYKLKIKKSLFIGHIKYVEDTESARIFIREVKKRHKQANHNCSAYIIGETFFSSDDREPSGTAGRPILNMLKKYNMTNVVLVVTRYFGGVELGIRGLIVAYGEVAEGTINEYQNSNN